MLRNSYWFFSERQMEGTYNRIDSEHDIIQINFKIRNVDTAWKVSVFGVILVRIFPHLYWIRKLYLYWIPKCGKIQTRITPNTDTFTQSEHYTYLPVLKPLSITNTINIFWLAILRLSEIIKNFFQQKDLKMKKTKWFLLEKPN